MGAEESPWYEAAFRAAYLDVYAHRDLPAARREVAHLVAGGVRSPVLDLACGQGRHALAMREAGLTVFGADLSSELLERAGELGEAMEGRLVRADQRAVPFRAGALSTVTMLFSSFGYFGDEENAAVLAEVARVLAPGGTCVLDLMNPARIRATLVPESRTERDGMVLHERRRLAGGGTRVVKEVRLGRVEGAGAEEALAWREDVRIYDPAEVAALAAGAGFRVARSEGDFDGRPLTADSPRQLVWLERMRPRA